MDYSDWEYYGQLTDRHQQLQVLDAWVREISETDGNSEEALDFWLKQMLLGDALPDWWGDADLKYMRRQLLPVPEKWAAYIAVHRGNGRPDQARISLATADATDLEDVDAMAAHDGALFIGFFDSRQEAERAAVETWHERVTTDGDGYTQWA
jgi:hypothetical protein